MIIELVLKAIYNILDLLMILEIPSLPTSTTQYINAFFTYIETGAGILANYTPLSYLLTLFFVIVAVDAGIMIYHFIMWIIKKIPMLGVS